jgi:hypothetical protein
MQIVDSEMGWGAALNSSSWPQAPSAIYVKLSILTVSDILPMISKRLEAPLNRRDFLNVTALTIIKYPYMVNYTSESKNPCFYMEKSTHDNFSTVEFRCIPYYMLIGFPKCGTTYMAGFLHQHPQILALASKEIHYWCMQYYKNMEFYSGRFSKNTAVIKEYINERHMSKCPYVFGDHTPGTGIKLWHIWDGV